LLSRQHYNHRTIACEENAVDVSRRWFNHYTRLLLSDQIRARKDRSGERLFALSPITYKPDETLSVYPLP
jgi:hypothetical protein